MSKQSGNHNPDEVLLGIHTTPEFKALVGVVADKHCGGKTITETMVDALLILAERYGVTRGGKVCPEYRDEIILRAAQLRAAKKERQARTK